MFPPCDTMWHHCLNRHTGIGHATLPMSARRIVIQLPIFWNLHIFFHLNIVDLYWLVVLTIFKNIQVNGKDYSIYYRKKSETTNQYNFNY